MADHGPFTNGAGQAYEMSRRIDEVGTDVRDLRTSFDDHKKDVSNEFASLKTALNEELGGIKAEIIKIGAAEQATEKGIEGRQRRRELRYQFITATGFLASIAISLIALFH